MHSFLIPVIPRRCDCLKVPLIGAGSLIGRYVA